MPCYVRRKWYDCCRDVAQVLFIRPVCHLLWVSCKCKDMLQCLELFEMHILQRYCFVPLLRTNNIFKKDFNEQTVSEFNWILVDDYAGRRVFLALSSLYSCFGMFFSYEVAFSYRLYCKTTDLLQRAVKRQKCIWKLNKSKTLVHSIAYKRLFFFNNKCSSPTWQK